MQPATPLAANRETMRARKVKLYLYIIVVNSSCYIQRLLTKFRSSSSVLRSTFPHLLHPNDRADTQQLQFQSSKKGYEEDLANWRRFLKIVETEVGFDPLYPRTWDIYMEGNSHRSKQVPIHLPPSLTLLTAHIKKRVPCWGRSSTSQTSCTRYKVPFLRRKRNKKEPRQQPHLPHLRQHPLWVTNNNKWLPHKYLNRFQRSFYNPHILPPPLHYVWGFFSTFFTTRNVSDTLVYRRGSTAPWVIPRSGHWLTTSAAISSSSFSSMPVLHNAVSGKEDNKAKRHAIPCK